MRAWCHTKVTILNPPSETDFTVHANWLEFKEKLGKRLISLTLAFITTPKDTKLGQRVLVRVFFLPVQVGKKRSTVLPLDYQEGRGRLSQPELRPDAEPLREDGLLHHQGEMGQGRRAGQVQGGTSSPAAPWLSLGGRVWPGHLRAPPQEDLRPGRGRCPCLEATNSGSTRTARAPGTLGPVSCLCVHRPNLRRGAVGGMAASRARINSVSRRGPRSQGEPGHLPCTGPFGCRGHGHLLSSLPFGPTAHPVTPKG